MESLEKKVSLFFKDVFRKLGQMQYISRFVNPDSRFHGDRASFFSEIRVEGDLDDYHNLKIHPDNIRLFVEKWLEYKKKTSPFFADNKIEDFI